MTSTKGYQKSPEDYTATPQQYDFWFSGEYHWGYYYGCNYNSGSASYPDTIWNHADGYNVKVAVIDMGGFIGPSWYEPYVPNSICGNTGTYYSYDEAANTGSMVGTDYGPDPYHGRSCASLIFAPHNDNAGTVGAAPWATPYFFLTKTNWDVADAITDAKNWGVNVVSISLQYRPVYPIEWDSEYSACRDAAAAGTIIVATGGNDGPGVTNEIPGRYSIYDYTICVGAHNAYGSRSYWNYTQSSNDQVEIYAPGGGTDSNFTVYGDPGLNFIPAAPVPPPTGSASNTNYAWFNGTSAATPIVAGVVADLKQRGHASTVSQAKSYLFNNADTTHYSAGRALNALAAVAAP